mmetsp:Transcript_3723/g.6611  ORF Transcript_3723/g.6611 Transcript_3723/m.6611 type:complete len:96 (-) Transcript_3723:338-625(-)
METEDMVAEGASAPEAAEEENPAETEEAASGGVDGVSLALCLLPEIPEDRQSLERRDFFCFTAPASQSSAVSADRALYLCRASVCRSSALRRSHG